MTLASLGQLAVAPHATSGLPQQQALAQALFAAFASDVQLRVQPRIDEQALAAVLASFR